MAVAFDARMTAGNSADGHTQQANNVATLSSTGMTIGGTATLLVAMIGFEGATSSSTPSAVTMTWNGVSMTAQGSVSYTGGTNAATAYIFTLVSPTTGNHTLACNWTTSQSVYMSCASFTGTDTVTGINASDNTTATHTTSITVPSDGNGASVAMFISNGGTPTMNFTAIWADSALNPGGGGSYNLGGTSNAHTFTGAGGDSSALSGVHIISGSLTPVTYEDDSFMQFQPPAVEPTVSVW